MRRSGKRIKEEENPKASASGGGVIIHATGVTLIEPGGEDGKITIIVNGPIGELRDVDTRHSIKPGGQEILVGDVLVVKPKGNIGVYKSTGTGSMNIEL